MMNNNLKQNLKMKYKDFDMCDKIPDIVFQAAIKYAEQNSKKENLLLIESSKKYIERHIVDQARVGNKIYVEYLKYLLDSKKYILSIKCSVNVSKIEEKKEEIYQKILETFDGTKDLSKVISLSTKSVLQVNEIDKNKKEKPIVPNKKEKEVTSLSLEKDNNIKFLNSYLRKNNITLGEFSNITGIPQSELYDYLKIGRPIFSKKLEKIFKVFGVTTLDELKKVCESNRKINLIKPKTIIETQNNIVSPSNNKQDEVENNIIKKSFNIKFLNSILIKNNVSLAEFSKKVNIPTYNVFDYIKTGRDIPESKLKLILEVFDVSSYEELKEKANEKVPLIFQGEIKKASEENFSVEPIETPKTKKSESSKTTSRKHKIPANQRTYNISFLRLYLILNDIPVDYLAKKLHIKKDLLEEYLAGEMFPEKYAQDLLSFFKSDSMKDLIQKVRNNESIDLDLPNEEKNNLINITFIKDYLAFKNITLTKFASDINITYNTLKRWFDLGMPESNIDKLLKYFNKSSLDEIKQFIELEQEPKKEEILNNNFINIDTLLEILTNYDFTKEQYEIVVMLFSKENSYTVNQIAKLTESSKKDIYALYKKCLTIYYNEFSDNYNSIIKKILENRN